MNTALRSTFVAVSASVLLCLPAASWAGFSSGGFGGFPTGKWDDRSAEKEDHGRKDGDFLSIAVHGLKPAKPQGHASSFGEYDEWRSLSRGPSERHWQPRFLRGDSDLAIWNLVAYVTAQRDGKHFLTIKIALNDLWHYKDHSNPPVSPVPLPGAVWLMLMGLLGLAGARVTGVAGTGKTEAPREAPRGFGGAVPA